MKYTVRYSRAMFGDVVPLTCVVESMARYAASGHGAMELHWPPLKNIRPKFHGLVLDAAKSGSLKVCNKHGSCCLVDDIISSDAQAQANHGRDVPLTFFLYAKLQHLQEWGAARGDAFITEDTGFEVDWFDLDKGGNVAWCDLNGDEGNIEKNRHSIAMVTHPVL